MKILAFDTSSKSGSIATLEGSPPRLVAEWNLNLSAQHSERLLWGVDQVLEASGWKPKDLDLIGVGIGPGSFTGLRIGLTTARTLGQSLRVPVAGVSSLAALARPHALELSTRKIKTILVSTTDAAKGELFGMVGNARSVVDCMSTRTPDLWKRGVVEGVFEPKDLIKLIHGKLNEGFSWMAVGTGRHRYAEAWERLPKRKELQPWDPFDATVAARYVGLLAWEIQQRGGTQDALEVHPNYLRRSSAEEKLSKARK